MRFLQPCVLLILKRTESHGYALLDQLADFGFNPDRFDPSLVYRALRAMESSGWIASSWDDDSQGPRRRVYQILPEGEVFLAEWIADLRRTRDEIDAVITAFEQIETESDA